jgi:vanillate O-demethylase monooxygenase subunit
MFIKNTWYIAAWADDVTDKPFARTICNEALVIFRDKLTGKVGALQDRCCHRGTPLRFGSVVELGLQCGYHGMTFDCTGACTAIPGQERIPAKAKVRAFPIVEKDQFLWVWMGEPERADESLILDYPWHNDAVKWPHKHNTYHVQANYMLMVDNLMDLTHLGYVHATTIGGNPKVHVHADMKVTQKENGLHFSRWMLNSMPPPTYRNAVPGLPERVDRWQEFEYIAPGSIVQWSGALGVERKAQESRDQEGGVSMRVFHGLSPETETSCFYFWSTAAGYRQDDPTAVENLFRESGVAFAEDKCIVEAQQTMLAATGEGDLVDIFSDVARVHMRRVVQRRLAAEAAEASNATGARRVPIVPVAASPTETA